MNFSLQEETQDTSEIKPTYIEHSYYVGSNSDYVEFSLASILDPKRELEDFLRELLLKHSIIRFNSLNNKYYISKKYDELIRALTPYIQSGVVTLNTRKVR